MIQIFLKTWQLSFKLDSDHTWLASRADARLLRPVLKAIEPLTSSSISLSHLRAKSEGEPEAKVRKVDNPEQAVERLGDQDPARSQDETEASLDDVIGNPAEIKDESSCSSENEGPENQDTRVSRPLASFPDHWEISQSNQGE